MRTPLLVLGIATLSTALVAQTQTPLPAALQKHVAALQGAQSMVAKVIITNTDGTPGEVNLVYSRPNSFRIESSAGLALYDGTKLIRYTKRTNSWTEATTTPAEALKTVAEVDQWAWASFFLKDGLSEVVDARPGRKRVLRGKEYSEVALIFRPTVTRTASLFLDADGIARGFTMKQGDRDFVALAPDLVLGKEPAAVTTFAWTPPANAKKEEIAAAPTWKQVQALLDRNCMPCHDDIQRKSGFDFSSYQATMGSRNAVVAGDPDRSFLVRAMRGDGLPLMPPNRPLAKKDIDMVAAWIKAGAKQ